jgi:hypothetical protein
MLRNFLVIGAQRCGTTSLYEYLCAHPNVKRHKGATREIHFFDWQYEKGFGWYRSRFPRVRDTGCITGETSPAYIFDTAVPARVKRHKPYVKLIVLLRNPADRAYSHYYHNKSNKMEPFTFRKALEAESGRQHYAKYREWLNWSYLARGRYVEQLVRWFQYFPCEQFHITKSEGLFADPGAEMQGVFEFLELEPFSVNNNTLYNYEIYNKQKYRKYTNTYDWLVNYFKPYNEQLYRLLDRDFGW